MLVILGLVAAGTWGAGVLWKSWQARPRSANSVQDQVRGYLKKEASPKEFTSDYDFGLRSSVAAAQTNAHRWREEAALTRTNLAQAQIQVTTLTRQLNEATEQQRLARRAATALADSLKQREKRLVALTRTNLQAADTNLLLLQTNGVALRGELASRQETLQKAAEQIGARQAALAAMQNEVKALKEQLKEKDATAITARRELAAKEQALAYQHQNFARLVRTNIANAGSYAAIYTWIGRTLWTADRLLASGDAADQRSGALLAHDAVTYAIQNAENHWLAARISEGWIWPNLEKFDAAGKPRAMLSQVLQTTAEAFNRASETNNLVKNFRLRLEYAQTPRAADNIRYNLANVLEQSGETKEALDLYRSISDTNYLTYAERRIAWLEKRLQTSSK